MSKEKSKVIIIGSGISGSLTGALLHKRGYDVNIFDHQYTSDIPNEKINNATRASLGILMGNCYSRLSGRGWKLRQKSMQLWSKWIEELSTNDIKLSIDGPLIKLAHSDEEYLEMKKFIALRTNKKVELLDERITYQLKRYFPKRKIQGFISHDDGRINPRLLMDSLREYLQTKKVTIYQEKIIQIKKIINSRNKWSIVNEIGEEYKSEFLILCNSVGSQKLLETINFKIELEPVLGQALELEVKQPNINLLKLPKIININGINIIPISEKQFILGSTLEYGLKADEDELNNLYLHNLYLPKWTREARTIRKWYGIRCRPKKDYSPIIKVIDENLLLCTGLFRNGILLAPACAEWIANEIDKKKI